MFSRFFAIALLVLIIPACSSVSHEPYLAKSLASIMEPTFSESSATPTAYTLATATSSIMATPIRDWEGIPVIAEATGGQPIGGYYVYSVNESFEKAEQFYLKTMAQDGWTLSYCQFVPTTKSGDSIVSLTFRKENKEYSVILVFNAKDDFTKVSAGLIKP